MPSIRRDEWLALLEDVSRLEANDGLTLTEIVEAVGDDPLVPYHRARMMRKMKAAIHAGRVSVGRGWRQDVSGKMTSVPVYLIAKGEP